MLSDIARDQLRRRQVSVFEKVRACSACGTPAGQIKNDKPHPYQDSLNKIQDLLNDDPSNRTLRARLHRVNSAIHHISRCCGARFKTIEIDAQEALYQSWLNRHKLVDIPITELREGYGPSHVGCDDDFILMNCIWSLADHEVRYRIRIFREEDEHQAKLNNKEQEIIKISEIAKNGRKLFSSNDVVELAKKQS